MSGVLLPVTPEKISYKIKNNNKTIDLMNGSSINVLRQPGLTEISFKALIPCRKYPYYKNKKRPIKGIKKNI